MSLDDAIGILEYFGFVQADTEGSHLQFEVPYGGRYTIKKKNPVDKGFANAIILGIKQADEFDGELILKNGALNNTEKEKYRSAIQTAKERNVLGANKYRKDFMQKSNEKKALAVENLKKALLVVFDNIYDLKTLVNADFDEKKKQSIICMVYIEEKGLKFPLNLIPILIRSLTKLKMNLKIKKFY